MKSRRIRPLTGLWRLFRPVIDDLVQVMAIVQVLFQELIANSLSTLILIDDHVIFQVILADFIR